MPSFNENRLSFKRIFGIKRPLNDFIRLLLMTSAQSVLSSNGVHHV